MTHDPVRDPDRPCQLGAVRRADLDQPTADEGAGRPQPCSSSTGRRLQTTKTQGQSDGGVSQRDVLVEVAVELLEPAIDRRRRGNEQQLDVELREVERALQRPQPDLVPLAFGQVRGRLDRALANCCVLVQRDRLLGRSVEDPVEEFLGDVEATEPFVLTVSVLQSATPDLNEHVRLDDPEPRQQVPERCVRARGGRVADQRPPMRLVRPRTEAGNRPATGRGCAC